jgi:hypothetical protein
MPTGVVYAASASTGEAFLGSLDRTLTEWSRALLGDDAERRTLPALGITTERWLSPAPLVLDGAPDVVVLSSELAGDERRVRVRVTPAPETWMTVLSLGGSASADDVVVDGRRMPDEPRTRPVPPGNVVTLIGAPEQGFDVEFTAPAEAAELRVRGITPGLPASPELTLPALPADLMIASKLSHVVRVVIVGAPARRP